MIESFLRQASIAIARRQTEERLRLSEKRIRGIIEYSRLPSALIDNNGRYAVVNRPFTELFGYNPEDIPNGKTWFTLAFPDPTLRKEAIDALVSDHAHAPEGQMQPRTFEVQCKNGEKRTVLFRPVLLCDGSQQITYEDLGMVR